MYAMGEMNKSYITKVLQLDVHISFFSLYLVFM